jgi:hypothetical protein
VHGRGNPLLRTLHQLPAVRLVRRISARAADAPMNDRIRVVDATVDTMGHRLTLSPRDNSRISGVLAYEQLPDSGLRIRGKLVRDSVDVTLRRVDERMMFRLLR